MLPLQPPAHIKNIYIRSENKPSEKTGRGQTDGNGRKNKKFLKKRAKALEKFLNLLYTDTVFKIRGCSSPGRAIRSQRIGSQFESDHLHQPNTRPKPCKSWVLGAVFHFRAKIAESSGSIRATNRRFCPLFHRSQCLYALVDTEIRTLSDRSPRTEKGKCLSSRYQVCARFLRKVLQTLKTKA